MTMPHSSSDVNEVRDTLERIEQKLERLDHLITGNGEPSKGIIVKLDRVEQRQDSQVKAFWAVVSAFTVAAVSLIFRVLTIGPTPK